MGEVVATIRDKRGAPTILEWVRACGGADTRAVAARFAMAIDDARRELRHLERKGLLQGKRVAYSEIKCGGATIMWTPVA